MHRSIVDSEPTHLTNTDRRSEERRPASGRVILRFSDPGPLSISGNLLDISNSGFRAAHDYRGLETGQVIEFAHDYASGRARVMWNRILEGVVQSGFVIL